METENILCQKNEHIVLNGLFEDFKTLLQDSDAGEEKERVKSSLRKMTDNTTYIILGNEGVGKTNLLRAVFKDMLAFADRLEGNSCEYRWGEQDILTPLVDGTCKHFVTSENMKGISIIDTKGINVLNDDACKTIRGQIERSSAVFVVFDAGNIRSPKLWDVIEGCPEKRMIFILTKCDLISEEDLAQNIGKMKSYMQESGVSAPMFAVNISDDKEIAGTVSVEYVRTHIRDYVVGKNPILNKQMENVQEMKKVLIQLRDSFTLRKKQYTSDYEILQKINHSMDNFVLNHKQFLNKFINQLTIEVNKDIDNYENEIISKLDPYKIKERFRNKEDFQNYLNMVNENYKTMMSDSVNRKTIEAIKSCLRDLEIVFQEAVGYFNTRENILALNDKFYGSLSTSRKQMVNETKEVIVSTGELYRTLSDASETLFMQIWEARKKYDASARNINIGSTVTGGVGVGGVAAGILAAINAAATGGAAAAATGTTAAATAGTAAAAGTTAATAGTAAAAGTAAVGLLGSVLIVAVAAIVGAIVINKIAKAFFDPRNENKLEETTRQCIKEFKAEVNQTRIRMIDQITAQITEIFENELATVDGCFTEFRMGVNIDERKIPMLEQRLLEAEDLLMKIESI